MDASFGSHPLFELLKCQQCHVLGTIPKDQPTANLLGPLVINPENRQAVQAVRDDAQYSVQHPLFPREENSGCS